MGQDSEAREFSVRGIDGTELYAHSFEKGGEKGGVPNNAPRSYLTDGLLCDGYIWKYLREDVARLMPVTHWHFRGHGKSEPPKDGKRITIEDHADDLSCVRRATGSPKVVLFGHSMGCQVALENYHRNPEGVAALVLVSGTYGKLTSTFHGGTLLEQALPKLIAAVERWPTFARAIWTSVPADLAYKIAVRAGEIDGSRIREEDMLPYLRNMRQVDCALFLKMLEAAGRHTSEPYLGQVRVPTLVISGSKDTFTPSHVSKHMAELIPGAEFVVLQGGTHAVPLEQHQELGEHVRDFLQRRVL